MSVPQALDDQSDEVFQSTVFIQKTIKGRAIQNMLLRGMSKFHETLEEVKETHSIAAIRNLFPKEFSCQIDNQEQLFDEYKRVEEALKNDEKLQEELKKVESKDAGNLLTFLEKELKRLKGEKHAHALFLLAERERYSRQAVTMGRVEFESQFRNDAITLYLENILLEGVNRAGKEGSREYIRKVAKKIDRKASRTVTFDEQIEEFSDESNTEDVSEPMSDIVSNDKVVEELLKENLIPHIIDRIKNKNFVSHQKKYLNSAHQELFREEFQQSIRKKENQLCIDILNELIEAATVDNVSPSESRDSSSSREAEVLASQIVEHILNEIIESKFEFSRSSTENSTTHGSYDGDYSNVQSTSEAESTTEALANEVVQSILNDIILQSLSSSTLLTETDTQTETSDAN